MDRGDIGLAEPLLDLGDVGVVQEGIGAGRGAERMRAETLDVTGSDLAQVGQQDLVDAVDRQVNSSMALVPLEISD